MAKKAGGCGERRFDEEGEGEIVRIKACMQHAKIESDGVESFVGGHNDSVEHEGGGMGGMEENGFGVGEIGGGGGESGAGEEAGGGE